MIWDITIPTSRSLTDEFHTQLYPFKMIFESPNRDIHPNEFTDFWQGLIELNDRFNFESFGITKGLSFRDRNMWYGWTLYVKQLTVDPIVFKLFCMQLPTKIYNYTLYEHSIQREVDLITKLAGVHDQV